MVIETQVFLNYFLDGAIEPLLVDGIQGNRTNSAIRQAITKLKAKFTAENLSWNNSFNFIGIRTGNTITNRYDDWFVIYTAGTITAIPASTKAGTPAIMKYFNRIVRGIRGFGTIVENQQIDYLLVTPNSPQLHWNSNWTGIGFLFQDRPIQVYRDPNTDNVIDKTVQITSNGDGFNVHSWKGVNAVFNVNTLRNTHAKVMNLTNSVNNMSEGCQVTTANYWTWLFDVLRRNMNSRNRITYTLLQW